MNFLFNTKEEYAYDFSRFIKRYMEQGISLEVLLSYIDNFKESMDKDTSTEEEMIEVCNLDHRDKDFYEKHEKYLSRIKPIIAVEEVLLDMIGYCEFYLEYGETLDDITEECMK